MSKEIVIRDVYAALMEDDDWDGTTAASVDAVLEMYGYGPENPGHGIIGQISDVLYTQDEWDRSTANAIAMALAEDGRRRRIEAIGHDLHDPETSDFLTNVLRANPPGEYGGIAVEKYEHNAHYSARRGEKGNVAGFESVRKGDLVTVRMPSHEEQSGRSFRSSTREFVGTALGLTEKGWYLEGPGGLPVYATPDNIIAVGEPGEVRKGQIFRPPHGKRRKAKPKTTRGMPEGVGKVYRRRR